MANLSQVPLTELHFDPENPRLPLSYRHADDERVVEYLLLECNLIELMLSIGEHGFFLGEPLLVVDRPGGGYTVVEGNRRLGALKLLQGSVAPRVMPAQVKQAQSTAKVIPDTIPVLIFPQRDMVLGYLGYRHITGIKEWGPLAKARYLKQLRERHSGLDDAEANKVLAKEIGSKSSHVAKLLTGMTLLERARDSGLLNRLRLQEDDIPFSLLTTAIGYPNICEFIGLDGSSDIEAAGLKEREFEEFFTWVFDKSRGPSTVLVESRNFDKLNRVVANERALDELRRGVSLETADLYTKGPLEALRKLLSDSEGAIRNAQNTLSVVEGLDEADMAQSERIRRLSSTLHASIKELLAPDE